MGKVSAAAHFLGCTHEKGSFTLPNGTVVTSMTYNMEPFFKSCVDKYFSLAREQGFAANLKDVPTPFISEDHTESPQGKPCGDGPALYCPNCRHAFPYSESIPDPQWKAALKKQAEDSSANRQVGVPIDVQDDAAFEEPPAPPGAWGPTAAIPMDDTTSNKTN